MDKTPTPLPPITPEEHLLLPYLRLTHSMLVVRFFHARDLWTTHNTWYIFHTTLATKWLSVKNRTENTIVVVFIQNSGTEIGQMIVRSKEHGRFYGTCNPAENTCSTKGLLAGVTYDIWIRTCKYDADATRCRLLAKPLKASTKPTRKHSISLLSNKMVWTAKYLLSFQLQKHFQLYGTLKHL